MADEPIYGPAVESEVRELIVPANALVMLVGPSGSGKSWWAARHFLATQIVSSDRCRAFVADDETDQTVHRQAFAVFYEIIRRRLELGRLAVADSTSLAGFARRRLRQLAARAGAPVVAIVFCTPLGSLLENNLRRGRRVAEEVLSRHAELMAEMLQTRALEGEGYAAVHYLRDPSRTAVRLGPPEAAAPRAWLTKAKPRVEP